MFQLLFTQEAKPPKQSNNKEHQSHLKSNSIQLHQLLLSQIKKYDPKLWNVLKNIPQIIDMLFQKYHTKKITKQQHLKDLKSKCKGLVHFQNPQLIYIGPQTVIQHGSMIIGPAFIGSKVTLRKGAYIRPNVIIGDSCIIGNSVQIKNSILIQQCQIAHFNYVGDSIIGKKGHFSAGAITSNLKLDSTNIKVKIKEHLINSQMNKIGAFVGQNVEIGCNVILNPGSVICRDSVIYPMISFRGFLPPKSIIKFAQHTQTVAKL